MLFRSNEDNAGVQFLGDGYPNRAPLYTATIERDDFRLSKQYVNLVKGMDDPNINFENPFNGCTDPRLAAFIGEANVEAGRVDGFPYGVSETAATEYRGLNADIMLLKTTPRPVIVTPDYYVRMLDYPTACFMKCEANDWNAADFEEGINASIEMWSAGISKNNLDDYFSEGKSYVSDVMSKFASADTEKKKEMVSTQKYMHLLTQSYEAWAEYRRTGYPKSVLLPGDVSLEEIYEVESANKVENKVVKYLFEPSVETGGIVVSRLLYNSSEYSLNQANVEAAAASIGGDTYSTILWYLPAQNELMAAWIVNSAFAEGGELEPFGSGTKMFSYHRIKLWTWSS